MSIRSPEAGPLGETLLVASARAMTGALLVKSPWDGLVEFVFTSALHFLGLDCGFFREALNCSSLLALVMSCSAFPRF